MLTSLHIQNFKSWRETGIIRLAPLTVIFGANSAGKSSLGHLLLALKQTALSADRRRALNLGDATTPVDLGTFGDCLHGHDSTKTLMFDVSWKLPKFLEVRNPLDYPRRRFTTGDSLALHVALAADEKSEQPRVTELKYELSNNGKVSLDAEVLKSEAGIFTLDSKQFPLVKVTGRQWPLEEPEKFYRLSETSIARFQNAGFLTDLALATEAMLRSISYLGPLREHPRRMYQWSGDTPEDVGQKGEFAIAAILAAQGRKLNRGPQQGLKDFPTFIATWMKDLGLIHSFSVKPIAVGRKEYEVLLKTHADAPEVKITDVGFGISQVLPALVQAFYCPPNSTVWMEQPEIHLHPQVQAELADVFISAVQAREKGTQRNVQMIIESHSEHFLNRLQRRIAEEKILPEDVAIYFASRAGSESKLEELELDLYGDIQNWPPNFFGDEMEELTARTVAAAQRRKKESNK